MCKWEQLSPQVQNTNDVTDLFVCTNKNEQHFFLGMWFLQNNLLGVDTCMLFEIHMSLLSYFKQQFFTFISILQKTHKRVLYFLNTYRNINIVKCVVLSPICRPEQIFLKNEKITKPTWTTV